MEKRQPDQLDDILTDMIDCLQDIVGYRRMLYREYGNKIRHELNAIDAATAKIKNQLGRIEQAVRIPSA